ncbi:MAG: oligosaccharide flippase family protein [Thermoleophilaceae bacterium]
MTQEKPERESGSARVTEERLTPDDVRKRATRGVVTVTLRGIGIRGLGFLGNIVLARLLVPSDFGVIAFGYTIVAVGSYLADGGMASALLRREQPPDRDELRATLGLQLTTVSLVVALVAAIGLPLGEAGAVAAVMCLAMPIDALRTPNAILLERTLTYGPIVRAEVGEIVAYNAFAIAAVAAGMGVWGIALAVIVRAITGGIILLIGSPVGLLMPKWSWRRVRPLIRFGLMFQGVNFVNLGRDQGINVLAGAIGGLATLGYWSLTYRMFQAIFLVFESLWRVALPTAARLIAAGVDMAPILRRGVARTALLSGLIATPLAGSAVALVPVVFGSRWHETGQVLPFVCVGLVVGGPTSVCASGYLYAVDRAGVILASVVAHTLAWFAVSAPLLVMIGAPGIGIGLLAASAVDLVVLGGALRRAVGIRVLPAALPPIVASAAGAAIGYVVANRLGPTVPSVLASAASAAAIYLGAMLLFRRRDCEDVVGFARRTLDGRFGTAPAAA